MKKVLLLLIALVGLVSCNKNENNSFGDTSIVGTFVYDNGEIGSLKTKCTLDFQSSGNVFYEHRIGTSHKFTTDGMELYYKLNGDNLIIYYGVKGCGKEYQHTQFKALKYYGDYMEEILESGEDTMSLRYEKQ